MKSRFRILLTLAYILALAGHGLEHRLAAAQAETAGSTADKDGACGVCALLTFAGHELGGKGSTPVPVLRIALVPANKLAPYRLVALPRVIRGIRGARAPPLAA